MNDHPDKSPPKTEAPQLPPIKTHPAYQRLIKSIIDDTLPDGSPPRATSKDIWNEASKTE